MIKNIESHIKNSLRDGITDDNFIKDIMLIPWATDKERAHAVKKFVRARKTRDYVSKMLAIMLLSMIVCTIYLLI
jgi:hypothetical protein